MGKSILIVDDEAFIVKSLEYVMKQADFQVDVAYDGEEALQKVAALVPDLVILDVMMPKRDGFEVLETIRANPEWKSVRVIMLTAKGRDPERQRGLALGADDYLTKPFSTRDILARAREILAAERV